MSDFSLVAAVGFNGVIGDSKTNSLPWRLKGDLAYFRETTLNNTIVMGSKTFDSLGKPLKGRRNVVITRDERKAFNYTHVLGADAVYPTFEDVLSFEDPGFFVIGGGAIYLKAMEFAPKTLLVTIVDDESRGSVKFPIEGVRFLGKRVFYNDLTYTRQFALPWREENGIKYQFTGFGLDATP